VGQRDWFEWHTPYDDPLSPLSQRLAFVQGHLGDALDRCRSGTIRLISMCAGQGRDVIGVLAEHRRAGAVRATLVEWDERNVDTARRAAAGAGLRGVDVVRADAGSTDAYADAVPAEIVLVCGVFGNVSDDDIARTVDHLPRLCAPGATVIWTRHRRPPDLTPRIRSWFEDAGFVEESFEGPDRLLIGVGVNRLEAQPGLFEPGRRLFDFVGYDALMPP
jgi:Putative methyltransferase